MPVDTLKMNIAYSLFIFLIVTSSLVILDLQFEEKMPAANLRISGNFGLYAAVFGGNVVFLC